MIKLNFEFDTVQECVELIKSLQSLNGNITDKAVLSSFQPVSTDSQPIELEAKKRTHYRKRGKVKFPEEWRIVAESFISRFITFSIQDCGATKQFDNTYEKAMFYAWLKSRDDLEINKTFRPHVYVPFKYERGVKVLATLPASKTTDPIRPAAFRVVSNPYVDKLDLEAALSE